MQVTTERGALGVARARARKWLRIFQQLVRVLDRIEPQETPLARAFVFLVQRALGHLEHHEGGMAMGAPVRSLDGASEAGGEASGDELLAAVALARQSGLRRDSRDDPSGDELEVLLVLAGSLTESADGGAYGDPAVAIDDLVRDYRALQQLQSQEVLRMTFFPLAFRKRWALLLEAAAAKQDPLRRLAFELSVMKVIHALFALAIGWRRAAEFGRTEPEADAWFACSLGEALLKSTRR